MPSSVTFACRRRTLTSLHQTKMDGPSTKRSSVLLCHCCCCGSGTASVRPPALPDGYGFFRRGWRESDATSHHNHCRLALPQWRFGACFCVLIASSVMQKGYKECDVVPGKGHNDMLSHSNRAPHKSLPLGNHTSLPCIVAIALSFFPSLALSRSPVPKCSLDRCELRRRSERASGLRSGRKSVIVVVVAVAVLQLGEGMTTA